VAFTPASVLTLAACGHITGLVVDCGWLETTVTPVYCSRPLYHLARSTPLGGRAVYERLRALLRHRGKYRLPGRAAAEGVSDAVLTDKIVERVLSEGCFVAQSRPSSTPSAQQDQLAKSESESDDVEMLEDVDEEALVALLAESYSSSSAKDWNIVIPTERIASCPTLIVPGWIRERAAEVLFGDGQDEAPSLPEVVLETLLKVCTHTSFL
jgi:actin-related protein 10